MAIKDSVISQVLKSESTIQSSQRLYKRLRSVPSTFDLEKTKHKLDTNRTQTEHKLNTKLDTNRTQTEHKICEPNTNWTQTEHRTEHKTRHKLNTNRTQTEHKLNTNRPFSALVGLQRNLLLFLFQQSKISRSKTTQELSVLHIAEHVKIRLGSVKTTLKRLEEKGFIKRVDFKNGRSGWAKFEIPNSIYNDLLFFETEHKLNTNWTQTEHKLNTELNTELNTNAPSSSSICKKTTTTRKGGVMEETEIGEEFEKINFEGLKTIGFTKSHLAQIVNRSNLPADIIQESIDTFAFDLTKNNKATSLKKTPLDFFMGILVRGQAYAPPKNYETPQQESMRLFLERKRATLEIEKKQQEEAFELAFETWKNKPANQTLVQELLSKIEPWMKKNEIMVKVQLHAYYREQVWLKEKDEFFQSP